MKSEAGTLLTSTVGLYCANREIMLSQVGHKVTQGGLQFWQCSKGNSTTEVCTTNLMSEVCQTSHVISFGGHIQMGT